jgi:hypothetical protein
MKNILAFIVVSIFYLSCQKSDVAVDGTIYGQFTVGPLCGIEPSTADEAHPCGLSFEQLDVIYSKYTVQLIDFSTSKLIAEKKMDRTGAYSFTAPEGLYSLEYTPHITTTTKAQKLPTGFKISAGQKISMDISLDTGLR